MAKTKLRLIWFIIQLNLILATLMPMEDSQNSISHGISHPHPPGNNFFRPIVPYGRRPEHQTIGWRNQVALKNIFSVPKQLQPQQPNGDSDLDTNVFFTNNTDFSNNSITTGQQRLKRSTTSIRDLRPGDVAPPFSVVTLDGPLRYPHKPLLGNPLLIHCYDKRSGFLEALWNTPSALDGLLRSGPNNAHYLFLSASRSAYADALWMRGQIVSRMRQLQMSETESAQILARLHFGTTPLHELGNWIPDILKEWRCEDHNCGFYQAVFQADASGLPVNPLTFDCLLYDENCANQLNGKLQPIVLKRQDARYDWLPNMFVNFGSRFTQAVLAGTGCQRPQTQNGVALVLKGKIAIVTDGGCSYFKKVWHMQQSGALGVIVVADVGSPVHDMNCQGIECSAVLSIPASMVPHDERLMALARQGVTLQVRFQTTQSDGFYVAIDRRGRLRETGWLLYPSFSFFVWQLEGMDFVNDLEDRVLPAVGEVVVNVFNRTRMHGDAGAFAPNIVLPWDGQRIPFSKMSLELQLLCPGTTDRTCAEWDHTVHAFVCCDESPLCGMELGRWISPYRRLAGHWLTDASYLIPLLTAPVCNFTMKHPPWTDAWYPVLNLRFSNPTDTAHSPTNKSLTNIITGNFYPDHLEPMFVGSETFDLTYNSKFPVFTFLVHGDVKRVTAYFLITGHGSDNNNCAEFCVTSHYVLVNQKNLNSRVFTNAGTPMGCAQRVKHGVEPNQHGTWLYGRNGWCPGENVIPWIFDITEQLRYDQENSIRYFAHFNGTDPNPTANAGNIIISAYLTFWKEHSQRSIQLPYRQ